MPPLLLRLAVALLLALSASALAMNEDALHVESKFEYDGDSHFEFGRLMGERFREQIRARLAENVKLQTLLLPFYATPDGQSLYAQYMESHNATFPQYVEELQGMAQGSNLPFETLFLMNIIEEYEDSIPATFRTESVSAAARQPVLRCSDIVVTSTRLRAVAHNEDGGRNDLNRTAIITARIGSNPKFVAYTYLGDLPSGAFGFNENGIAFTLNFVQPAETFVGGLGRGFVSRDLLNAVDAMDAMARITRPKQATGHNFQLMDIDTHRVWNIEVASFDRHVIHEFTVPDGAAENNVTAFFHANQYQRLDIAQPPYESSLHRLKRYSELTPPTTVREALVILGDQEDRSWPVFHDMLSHERGDLSGYTMTTIVFDVLEGRAYSFRGNPSRLNVKFIWDLKTLKITPDSYESQRQSQEIVCLCGKANGDARMKAGSPAPAQGSATEAIDDDGDALIRSPRLLVETDMALSSALDAQNYYSSRVMCRCLGGTCVVFPCVLFLFVCWCLPSSKKTAKRALLILSGAPPLIYILSGMLLLCLVCCRQIQRDTENAQQAQTNLRKIAVTSGDMTAAKDHIPGRFAMFLAAAKDGNVFNFQWCLDNRQEPDQIDHLGRTALHWAAMSGSDEIVSLLLRNGASIDLPDTLEGLTPLHYAAYYGHVKITRLLVNAGASLTAMDNRKMNPLQLAEMASLKLVSVQPSHQMIIKFLRISMGDDVTPPLEHITGLTVKSLVERQIKALPQAQ